MTTCRSNYEHAKPCGPVGDPEACACGCRADDWFCNDLPYGDLSDCGCRVHEAVNTPSVQRPAFVTYCRTHAAAPDLLDFAKEYIARVHMIHAQDATTGRDYNPLCNMAFDLIAAATGAEVGT